jgi:hypothetical protein
MESAEGASLFRPTNSFIALSMADQRMLLKFAFFETSMNQTQQ